MTNKDILSKKKNNVIYIDEYLKDQKEKENDLEILKYDLAQAARLINASITILHCIKLYFDKEEDELFFKEVCYALEKSDHILNILYEINRNLKKMEE